MYAPTIAPTGARPTRASARFTTHKASAGVRRLALAQPSSGRVSGRLLRASKWQGSSPSSSTPPSASSGGSDQEVFDLKAHQEKLKKLLSENAVLKMEEAAKQANATQAAAAAAAPAAGGGAKTWNKPYPMTAQDAQAGYVGQVAPPKDERSPLQKEADRCAGVRKRCFVMPEEGLVAGEEVEVFFNRRGTGLNERPNVYVLAGWDGWDSKIPTIKQHMSPAGLFESDSAHWWTTKLTVPKTVSKSMDFVFSDGEDHDGVWDNNDGKDYKEDVKGKAPTPAWAARGKAGGPTREGQASPVAVVGAPPVTPGVGAAAFPE